MRAGQLRVRAAIYRSPDPNDPNAPRDDFGQLKHDPVKVKDVWCGIEPLSGRELFLAKTVLPDVTHEVTLRFDPTLKVLAKDELRIESECRVFNLFPLRNVGERNIEWKVLAVEKNV